MLRERRRQANYKPNRRLDRKSSRGMIYENEELRLRTININAEVERGQSDIRKLRRENEQLRREIWSLRDEYDRLNKLLKTSDNNCSNTESKNYCDNDEQDEYHNCSGADSGSQTDVSGSCCDCDNEDNNDYDWDDNEVNNTSDQQSKRSTSPIAPVKVYNSNSNKIVEQQLNINNDEAGTSNANIKESSYDHLSVVSEENLTNADDFHYAQQQKYYEQQQQQLLMSFSPTTPPDQLIPPLSHFENIIEARYSQNEEDLNSHSGRTTSSSTTTDETVIQRQTINDWDFNIQSPFLQRKHYIQQQQQQMQLTTFTCSPTTLTTTTNTITSPKHFFSPIKPKIHLKSLQAMISEIPTLSASHSTTALGTSIYEGAGNNTLKSSLNTLLSSDISSENQLHSSNIDKIESYKPDICVSNVLGSPSTFKQQKQYRESYFQNGGNLEDLLQDIELLSSDILRMQLDKSVTTSTESLLTNSVTMKLTDVNKSLDNINKNCLLDSQVINNNSSQERNKDRKPYRSEMNLVLNFNGQNPVFVPKSRPSTPLPQPSTISTIKKILQHANSENDLLNDKKTRDLIDTPLTYSNVNIPNNKNHDQRSLIPRPMTLFPDNHNYLDVQPLEHQLQESNTNLNSSIPLPITPLIVSPSLPSPSTFGGHFYHNPSLPINKYHPDNSLIVQEAVQKSLKKSIEPKTATINSALMKRNQFSIKRSGDLSSSENNEAGQSTEIPQISINMDAPAHLKNDNNQVGKPHSKNSAKEAKIKIVPSLSEKNEENPISSPLQKHSSVHSTNENKDQQQQGNRHTNITGNTISKRHHRHHHTHHQCQKSASVLHRKLSQDESLVGGTAVETLKLSSTSSSISSPANKIQNRRHSDDLLTPPSPNHHHHHHHHPRNSGLHDSHHDLFIGGNGTSISERQSNSLASSRESSATSISLRSQKQSHQRKISISDGTTNNKIPWCACWGNGCL